MKKISRRIKRTLALALAAVMVFSTDAPFTLLEAMVANAEELVPDREKMPEVASETEADDPDEDDNSGGNNGGQPPMDNGQDDDSNVIVDNNINDDMLVASKGQLLSAKKQARENEYLVPSDEYATLQDAFDAIENNGVKQATIVLSKDISVDYDSNYLGVEGASITYTSESEDAQHSIILPASGGTGGYNPTKLLCDTVFDDIYLDGEGTFLAACGNRLETTEDSAGEIYYIFGNDPVVDSDEIDSIDLVLNGAIKTETVIGTSSFLPEVSIVINKGINIFCNIECTQLSICGIPGADQEDMVVNGDIRVTS